MQSIKKLLAAVVISAFAGASAAHASVVVPSSTFDISVVGFTGANATGTEFVLVPNIVATFGSTSFGTGLGSQVATVTSSETIVAGQPLDTVTISVPTNFDMGDPMPGGQPIDGIFVQIGEALDATFGPTTQNGLQLSSPVIPANEIGWGTANSGVTGTIKVVPPVTFNGSDTMLYAYEGVQLTPVGDINPNAINSFTINVPEPMSGGIIAAAAGLSTLCRRRRA